MSILWMPARELDRKLFDDYRPHGLVLYPAFHSSIHGGDVLRDWIKVAPETGDWLSGLNATDAYAGLFLGTPFSIMTSRYQDRSQITLSLPARASADGTLDPSLLDLLRLAPRAIFTGIVYFETLPFEGAGHGVLERSSGHPVFSSPRIDEATRVQDFLNDRVGGDAFLVGPISAAPLVWIVVGPPVGDYISRIERFENRDDAVRMAQGWSARTGATFRIFEGQIGKNLTGAFDALVRSGGPYSAMAAARLARSGAAEVFDILVDQLAQSPLQDVDLDASYVDILHKANRALPIAFVERARGASAPWQLRALVEKIVG